MIISDKHIDTADKFRVRDLLARIQEATEQDPELLDAVVYVTPGEVGEGPDDPLVVWDVRVPLIAVECNLDLHIPVQGSDAHVLILDLVFDGDADAEEFGGV